MSPTRMTLCRRDVDEFTKESLYNYGFQGEVGGRRYLVQWQLEPYAGPGRYPLSGRSSDETVLALSDPAGDILGFGRGSTTPGPPDGRTGTLDVDVSLKDGGYIRVTGTWTCGTAF